MSEPRLQINVRQSSLRWRPTPEEVEAIVLEMRPVIAALTIAENRRLRQVIASKTVA
jgi:hypothetical protein